MAKHATQISFIHSLSCSYFARRVPGTLLPLHVIVWYLQLRFRSAWSVGADAMPTLQGHRRTLGNSRCLPATISYFVSANPRGHCTPPWSQCSKYECFRILEATANPHHTISSPSVNLIQNYSGKFCTTVDIRDGSQLASNLLAVFVCKSGMTESFANLIRRGCSTARI